MNEIVIPEFPKDDHVDTLVEHIRKLEAIITFLSNENAKYAKFIDDLDKRLSAALAQRAGT